MNKGSICISNNSLFSETIDGTRKQQKSICLFRLTFYLFNSESYNLYKRMCSSVLEGNHTCWIAVG